MKDNNKKPREYRDALSGVYIPEWSELSEDEKQEALKEIYVDALNHIYMASALNEIVKNDGKFYFNSEIIADSLFKHLYRFVAEDKIRNEDNYRFLEEHPEYLATYEARYKIGREFAEAYFGQAYMDKVKPEFLVKEIKMTKEKQPYKSSAFSDEIKAKLDKIRNMSDKELLDMLKDDDKMKELTDIKCDFVMPDKNTIDLEALYLNAKRILIEAGEDIDNENISQLIINYMQKTRSRVKFCLKQLAEKDKKIHDLNLRIHELESDLRISNWLDEEFDKAEAEYENNNHSEEANDTSSSN